MRQARICCFMRDWISSGAFLLSNPSTSCPTTSPNLLPELIIAFDIVVVTAHGLSGSDRPRCCMGLLR
jgi:hypothetical protein